MGGETLAGPQVSLALPRGESAGAEAFGPAGSVGVPQLPQFLLDGPGPLRFEHAGFESGEPLLVL